MQIFPKVRLITQEITKLSTGHISAKVTSYIYYTGQLKVQATALNRHVERDG